MSSGGSGNGNGNGKAAWRGAVRGLPGICVWYEVLDRLNAVQSELRVVNKRLAALEQGGGATLNRRVSDRESGFDAAVAAVGGRTTLDRDRLWVLWQAARNAGRLSLPALEAGSFRGGSASFLAHAFVEHVGREVPLDVVDTFDGHPEESLSEHDEGRQVPGHFARTSFEEVSTYLSDFSLTRVHRGSFSAVAPSLDHPRYGLVHLDMDLYRPTIEALRFSAERLAAGGVIVLDDYGAKKCPGIGKATEEFLAEHDEFQAWHPLTEQLVLLRLH